MESLNIEKSRPPFRRATLTVLVALALGGCAVQPTPIGSAEYQAQVQDLHQRLFAGQEKISAPLTLSDATARAIKYNMDYRVRMMEQALSAGQTELANADLLPKLTLSAGYSTRSNDSFGYGFGTDGRISPNPTASQERTHETGSIGFAWNVLDFGLSYVRAKQMADQSLISEERRRKALQNLVQDVRLAWWRAETAQRLRPEIDALLDEIDQASSRAKLIETRRLLPPLQIVAYRRSLLDLEQQLSVRRQELGQAEVELATLMNLPMGTTYTLAKANSEDFVAPILTAKMDTLEEATLKNRPELREESYKTRVSNLEWKKQMLGLLPSFGLEVADNYDSNRYLLNNQWASGGLNLSFGLLKLFSLPAMNRAQQAQSEVDETRKLATTAAILAQTRLAAVRYDLLAHEFGVWDDASKDDARIVTYLQSAKQVGLETELELIRARARALVSRVQRDFVHANLQAAMGRLYNSIGLDSLPAQLPDHDAATLASALNEQIGKWEQATFSEKPLPKFGTFALEPVSGVPASGAKPFEAAMLRILRLSKVALATDGKPQLRLQAIVELAPQQASGRPSKVKLRLIDSSGHVVAEAEQSTMLLEPVSNDQWQALGEGAAYRMIEPMRKALRQPAAVRPAAALSDTKPSAALWLRHSLSLGNPTTMNLIQHN
ncbi:MAG TPA: TolC family protein [Noviherbaspirillum sp.]|uniref:TolC family protein n=1 Tax=Noviherbaspirillum sp. TaxID=1926288 RepID=UPI002B472262|nr:TolC family protein [Noviherbaspirillum sp.]HJV85366.1 TolC family protein [Noviherbaspirillum sp.]